LGDDASVGGNSKDVTAQDLKKREKARPAILGRAFFIFVLAGEMPEL
jgi:hypothetical protein